MTLQLHNCDGFKLMSQGRSITLSLPRLEVNMSRQLLACPRCM
jgi:hypothetical protein